MLVLDASVVVDFLLARPPHAAEIGARLAQAEANLAAPQLLDVEVVQVLRRFVLRGDLSPARAELAIEHLLAMPIHRYDHSPLLARAFQLRDNATVYDALYITLAEGLDGTLLTLDARLASVPGHSATVDVIGATA
jgi:predicted nucleic acid-binding protein